MQRLNFVLPVFVRVAWAAEPARLAWELKLSRVKRAWEILQQISVQEGLRKYSVTRTPIHGVSAERPGIHKDLVHVAFPATCMDMAEAFFPPLGPDLVSQLSIVATKASLTELEEALHDASMSDLRRLLGYPSCCDDFYEQVHHRDHFIDTTWWTAVGASDTGSESRAVVVRSPTVNNVLWRPLNVRAVPHFPCHFNCPQTAARGSSLLELGRSAGYADEVAWLEEILSWPVQWSALHGIAETKTPILRFITNTDATAEKHTVRIRGSSYPEAGVKGLGFPYRHPKL